MWTVGIISRHGAGTRRPVGWINPDHWARGSTSHALTCRGRLFAIAVSARGETPLGH
jgi:hypothetical protein